MKAIHITLDKKLPLHLFSHALSPQWKPWKSPQPEKSPFVIEDAIAEFLSRRFRSPRRGQL